MTRGAATSLLAGFYGLCAVAVSGPGVVWVGDRLVLGVPAALLWNLLWVGLSFAALATYHLTGPAPGDGHDD